MSQNDHRYMALAFSEARFADCLGHRVGAVLASVDGALITSAYNGTARGLPRCTEGGCIRCANRDELGPGLFYDMCVCVHAEQNVLLRCAMLGCSTRGHILYTTMKPCLGCCKELINSGISEVVYQEDWELRMPEFAPDHERMLQCLNARRLES